MSKKTKEEVVVFRISELYLKPFKERCKEKGTTMSKELRKFIKEFIAR